MKDLLFKATIYYSHIASDPIFMTAGFYVKTFFLLVMIIVDPINQPHTKYFSFCYQMIHLTPLDLWFVCRSAAYLT